MAWYVWTIIVLLLLSYMQYSNPQSVDFITKSTWGSLQTWINTSLHFTPSQPVNSTGCPNTYDPVCGGGKTYNNICLATYAKVAQVTPGACT